MADAIFKFKFPEGNFELTTITRSQLSHFKQWYGQDYGERMTIIMKAIREDADAVACLVWACRKEHGLAGPDPTNMPDFDPNHMFVKLSDEDDELEKPPPVPLENPDES